MTHSRRDFLKLGSAAMLSYSLGGCATTQQPDPKHADLIIINGHIATQDEPRSFVSAVAIKDGRFMTVGTNKDVLARQAAQTQVIDVGGRTVIPGLNDSHLHVIRGGLTYNLELRWDGVRSLADAVRMLREQAQRTPPPQWVRVVGGWSEFQFAERRMPSLDEINDAAPATPVFILHLHRHALLNKAALRAAGYTRDTPDPPGGEIQRDGYGNPTGLLIARPNAAILYAALAKGPKLPPEHQLNSTRQFLRELNRLGLTSAIDAGGGDQHYPEDYEIINQIHRRGELTLRVAYNLCPQWPNQEHDDLARWVRMTTAGWGDEVLKVNGAGEILVFSAADFEDFVEPRPELPAALEFKLKEVAILLAKNRWPFRLHATYDESVTRFLNVFEEVNRDVPLKDLHWFFDHAETVSDRNLERIKALGGGIAIQHRMAYQGEYFVERYGPQAAARAPPISQMLSMGIPVGAGSDGTRIASYNPWVSLYWLITGKTVGGFSLYPDRNRLDRVEALRLYTVGSSWFSKEHGKKGAIVAGQLADLAVLSDDYFSIREERIKDLESVLTILGGKPVYAAEEFSKLSPPPLPVMPDWSPVARFGGYGAPGARHARSAHAQVAATRPSDTKSGPRAYHGDRTATALSSESANLSS